MMKGQYLLMKQLVELKLRSLQRNSSRKLLTASAKPPQAPESQNTNKVSEGVYIGTLSGSTALQYSPLVDEVFTNTKSYFDSYEKTYNDIIPKYGTEIGKMLFDPNI